MPPEATTNALFVAPSAADGVSVASSTTDWANSSWVELIASTDAAIVLAAVAANASTNAEFEVDIGKGTAGSEVVVATVRADQINSQGSPWLLEFRPLPVDNIATATRVAVRFRKAGTVSSTFTFKLNYYKKPLSGITTTAKASKVFPSAANGISITPNATAWANSAYAELVASTAAAITISGVVVNPAVATEFEVDIAKGAAASEVVVGTVRGSFQSAAGGPAIFLFDTPIDNIPTATRVSARLRKDGVSTAVWNVALTYQENPL